MWQFFIASAAALALLAAPVAACERDSARAAAPGPLMQLAQAKDSARPARGPETQVSVPNAAPPATTDRTTAATDQGPVAKQMNQEGANKVETEGK